MAAKKKKTRPRNNLGLFLTLVFGVTAYFLTIVWVKNECMVTGRNLDKLRRSRISVQNDRELLKSNVLNLMSNQRISTIAAEKFGMIQPAPEQLIVVSDISR